MITSIHALAAHLQQLNKKDFERFLLFAVGGSLLLALGMLYYFNYQDIAMQDQIRNTNKLHQDARLLAQRYEKIERIQQQIKKQLEENPNFEIKSFFEKFCRTNNVSPQSDWTTPIMPVPGNDQLEEVFLQARFNNQTTQRMIDLLAHLATEEMVYAKELKVHREEGQKISFDLTIATLKYKT